MVSGAVSPAIVKVQEWSAGSGFPARSLTPSTPPVNGGHADRRVRKPCGGVEDGDRSAGVTTNGRVDR